MTWIAATVAGAAGSLAMDLVQNAWTAVFERGQPDDERDEETEAIVAVVKRIAPFVPGDFADRHPGDVGRVLHYAFGCGFACAYALARPRYRGVAAANGLGFGLALWFLSDALLIPATHLGRSWFRYSVAQRFNAIVSHLAYAATVEAVLRFSTSGDSA